MIPLSISTRQQHRNHHDFTQHGDPIQPIFEFAIIARYYLSWKRNESSFFIPIMLQCNYYHRSSVIQAPLCFCFLSGTHDFPLHPNCEARKWSPYFYKFKTKFMAKNEDEIQGLPIFLQDGLKQIKLLSDDLDFRQKRKVLLIKSLLFRPTEA